MERARRYHRPLYVALLADAVLGVGLLAALAFTPFGDGLYEPLEPWPWWARTLAFAALVAAVVSVAALPLAFWRYLYERGWGFSTQGLRGWLADRVKALAVAVVLTSLPVLAA